MQNWPYYLFLPQFLIHAVVTAYKNCFKLTSKTAQQPSAHPIWKSKGYRHIHELTTSILVTYICSSHQRKKGVKRQLTDPRRLLKPFTRVNRYIFHHHCLQFAFIKKELKNKLRRNSIFCQDSGNTKNQQRKRTVKVGSIAITYL